MSGNLTKTLFLETAVDISGITRQLKGLIMTFSNSILVLFCAACTILAALHAFSYAKAEDPQQKQQAKGKISNLIIAFVVAFAAIAFINVVAPKLTEWMKDTIETVS